MPALSDVLDALRAWKQPSGSDNPFKLACRIEPGASQDELAQAAPGVAASEDLRHFWSSSREAWLFEDTEYGQWGLHLLNPLESIGRTKAEHAQRPDDLRTDDVVLGEFLGDSELLVYSPSSAGDRRFLIALPLDPRDDWFAAGDSVTDVLKRLLDADGEKYWEQTQT